jgi:hypothetical protein
VSAFVFLIVALICDQNMLLWWYVYTAIYLLYARLEEEHGLARHAMEVYDRATRAVQPEDQYEVSFCLFISMSFESVDTFTC